MRRKPQLACRLSLALAGSWPIWLEPRHKRVRHPRDRAVLCMACSDRPWHHPAGLDCALGWWRRRAYQARSLHPGSRLYLIGSRGREGRPGIAVVARVLSHPDEHDDAGRGHDAPEHNVAGSSASVTGVAWVDRAIADESQEREPGLRGSAKLSTYSRPSALADYVLKDSCRPGVSDRMQTEIGCSCCPLAVA